MASNQGTGNADFGAFPGTQHVSFSVADATITAGALVEAWKRPVATADHSVDEVSVEQVEFHAHDVVAGVGFTVDAFYRGREYEEPALKAHKIHGLWPFGWAWSD